MNNTNILLLSEDRLKTFTSLNDNFFGKHIFSAIKLSQEIDLVQIIGECLYEKLLDLVSNNTIMQTESYPYKLLLDKYITNYLAYKTLSHLVQEVSPRLANFGTMVSNDEHLENVSVSERDMVRKQFEYYADAYCKKMQEYLKANKELYPELDCGCKCDGTIKPNLESAVSSQLWLGGYRGRKLRYNK